MVITAIVIIVNNHQHAVAEGVVKAGLGVGDFPLENEAVEVDWGVRDADLSCLKEWA